MKAEDLRAFFERSDEDIAGDAHLPEAQATLLSALESGELRTARRGEDGLWLAERYVKRGILSIFRSSPLAEYSNWPGGAVDKEAFCPRIFGLKDEVRMVPGGSSVRRGACVRPGAVIMPPAFINVGAFVGSGSMVDSHALVGSCAQIGERVHLSAGAQIGGVLEPAGARPVIVEDGCFIGGLTGLFEGVLVRENAVLAPGTIISASTLIYDLVNDKELKGEVPQGAVVVPGTRPALSTWAAGRGIALYAPCIVKYRDAGTDAATALESALR
ncbi:MAG TPA: 2,3,4,5-tetrahydropyridine-2,6-dicarboxylate N-succinyltransferase [Spirochaetaceae bacterium]|jgi:2,3,4,5-tetrahydropyridine-2-carboxylate N-succinyltransferase|nr:2,3,4,5-tetrahydropyridine-2,6-dicarboxylate N-succinyltransferase [Spirochaetaceae bacterium]